MIVVALGALLTGAGKPAARPPGEPEERPPLPWLPHHRLRHVGEFVSADEASPCLPVRNRLALRVAGSFVGVVLVEWSQTCDRTWSVVLRGDQTLALSAPGAVCVGGFAFGESLAFARCRCLSLASGSIGWSLSTW